LNQRIDLLFQRTATYELVHNDILRLTNSKCPIRRLILDSGIPPSIEVNHVRRGSQIESGAAGFQRQYKKRNTFFLLKPSDEGLPLLNPCFSMQDQTSTPEYGFQERGRIRRNFAELCKDENFFLACGNHIDDLAQSSKLAAVSFCPFIVAEPLRWMIAD